MLILEGVPTVPNNTYKAVRVLADDYDLFLSVWCNNEHELYDLTVSSLWNISPGPSRLGFEFG